MTGLRSDSLTPGQRFCLAAVFAIALLLRLYEVNNLILDHPSMRQGHTALIARHFYEDGMNILRPDVGAQGRGSDYWYNEFSLYPWLLAAVYQVTGEEILLGRLLNLLFSLAAMAQLFRLVRRYSGNDAALFAIAVFAVTPLSVYFSRTVQRQMMVLFLGLTMLDEFDRWLLHHRARHYWTALVAGALAILTNPPIAHLGLPLIYLAVVRTGLLARRREPVFALDEEEPVSTAPDEQSTPLTFGLIVKTVALGALILLPAALWYSYALDKPSAWSLQPSGRDPDLHFRNFRDPGYYLVWLTPHFFKTVWLTLVNEVLTPVMTIFAAGCILLLWSRIPRLFYVWLLAVFVYFCLDVNPIAIGVHNYYYLNALPVLCAFAGVGLAWLWGLRGRLPAPWHHVVWKPLVLVLLGITAWQGFVANQRHYEFDFHLFAVPDAVNAVEALVPEDALVFIDKAAPEVYYLVDRDGWCNNPWDVRLETLQRIRAEGCEYLLLFNQFQVEENPGIKEYLAAETEMLMEGIGFRILRYKSPAGQ